MRLRLVFDYHGGISVWRSRRVNKYTTVDSRWFWIRRQGA